MFYPEFSPAMKWHLEQNQKLYTNFMFHGTQNKEAFDQYHGECISTIGECISTMVSVSVPLVSVSVP